MIFEIDKNIYRIEVPLEGSALGTLNAYFFRGSEEDYLMDTGFNTQPCEDSLRASLRSLAYRPDRLNIINTHLHMDHTGLNHWFIGEKGHIYIGNIDFESMLRHYRDHGFKRGERDRLEGADDELYDAMITRGPESDNPRKLIFDEEKHIGLEDGEIVDTGVCRLQMVLVPGHTPGNTMFYDPDRKIMYTGDHVLFDITPNITFWPGVEDALDNYLDSLDYAEGFDVELAMPGHRGPGNYYERIKRIKAHHQRRLAEIVGILGDEPGLNAYEIARRMRWKIHLDENGEIPPIQMWFAAGECMSHLDKLVLDGVIVRREGEPYRTYFVKEDRSL